LTVLARPAIVSRVIEQENLDRLHGATRDEP
jgi:hypothetical protein